MKKIILKKNKNIEKIKNDNKKKKKITKNYKN